MGHQAAGAVPPVECPHGPTDCISAVAWAPPQLAAQKNFLAASSWDKTVRVWEVQTDASNRVGAVPVSQQTNTLPILDCCFSPEGNLFFGGCCQTVKMVSLAQQGAQPQQVAASDLPINKVKYSAEMRTLITGSWNGHIKLWDCKSPNPTGGFDCQAPVVDFDVTGNMLTVCTARQVILYDLQSNREVKRGPPYKIKSQLRCITNFPDKSGYVVGSVEGRACVMWNAEVPGQKENFSFRCHRDTPAAAPQLANVFSVNSVSFHTPMQHVFATAGSNGTVTVWDGIKRQKVGTYLVSLKDPKLPISCGKFDSSGMYYAYAASYDWTKGQTGYNPQYGHKVCIRRIVEKDVKYEEKPTTGGWR